LAGCTGPAACGGKNGCNGFITGALNARPGIVVGNALAIKECNILRDNQTAAFQGFQGTNPGC
jgi:hypothetical protein